jgi:nucleotidyltransferase substrate binding protein (TIGR01987 family)
MALEIEPLANAVARLQEGVAALAREPDNTLLRDGVIQRFEFTYELAHRTLKRALEAASPSPEQYDRMFFGDLIRSGNEQGLLMSEWPVWKHYRDLRNKSAHSYDEGLASEVAAGAPAFVPDAAFLCDQLRARFA